jgi:ribonuclease HI
MLTLQFDGLFRGAPQELHLGENAGFMCFGWVILRDGQVVARGHGGYARGQDASSNVAEYLALIEGLEALLDMEPGAVEVEICGDAKSVIDQMTGHATVTATSIKPLYRRASKLAARFPAIYWSWTPRRNNHTADALTRRALHQIRINPEPYEAAMQAFHACKHTRHALSRLRLILDLRLYNAPA